MNITTIIVVLVLVLIGIGFLFERAKKSSAQSSSRPGGAEPITADESGPTQTGRFKVQQMMTKSESTAPAKAAESADSGSDFDEDEEALPDPFEK